MQQIVKTTQFSKFSFEFSINHLQQMFPRNWPDLKCMVGCRQGREVKANTATSVHAFSDVFRSPPRPYVLPEYAEVQCRDYVDSPHIPSRRAVSIDPWVLQSVDDVAEDSNAETTDTRTSSSGDCSL